MTTTQDTVKFDRAALARLQAANLPHLCARDIAEMKEDNPTAREQFQRLDEYLDAFTPTPDGNCICCGAQQGAKDMVDALFNAHFRWSLTHGEGVCSRCGYPARAMHYIGEGEKEICLRNYILQYHPDSLSF